jgi:hypothetical protein
MAFDGGNVEVFGLWIEEGHCWGVDAREEGPAGARVPVGGAVDSISVGHFRILSMDMGKLKRSLYSGGVKQTGCEVRERERKAG